jgi:transposase-like protein
MDLSNTIFHDETAAREHLEAIFWPDGAVCPHCGEYENIKRLKGKSHRPGLHQCNSCRKNFTVTVGTVLERSKVPLHKWVMAFHLMASSKKGMSAHQLHRMLGVTYKTAWFMAHRIRESMREFSPGPMGGGNKVVEADETYVGGKAKNAKRGKPVPKKEAVVSLVERDGKVRSFHVPHVSRDTLRPILVTQIDRKSYLMTDEHRGYVKIGDEFAGHGTVNHSIKEYVRGKFWHTNTIEGYFSVLKRGLTGTYQHVSQQHLKRYLGEFDFRYNERSVEDHERAATAIKGASGKRLTYRRTNETRHA